jgi:HPt (histidine-containing phosphotransfer) domain-containing protein
MINSQNSGRDDPINYPEVLERIGGDTEFLEELLTIYFLEFSEKRSQIEAALRGGDFVPLQEVGHSLKGASANLSLPSLRREATALEAAGREKNIEKARQALISLVAEGRVLRDFLKLNPPKSQSV